MQTHGNWYRLNSEISGTQCRFTGQVRLTLTPPQQNSPGCLCRHRGCEPPDRSLTGRYSKELTFVVVLSNIQIISSVQAACECYIIVAKLEVATHIYPRCAAYKVMLLIKTPRCLWPLFNKEYFCVNILLAQAKSYYHKCFISLLLQ